MGYQTVNPFDNQVVAGAGIQEYVNKKLINVVPIDAPA
jgi:hypothetical protein